MPVLQRIERRGQVGALDLPRQRFSGAQRGFAGIAEFGEAIEQAQIQQDDIDIKIHAASLDSSLEKLKEEVKSEPDFAKRETLYREKSAELLGTTLESVQNHRVKKGLSDYYSITQSKREVEFTRENQKEWGFARTAQLDALGETAAGKIVSASNPQEAEMWRRIYDSQVTSLSAGPYAPLNAAQAEVLRQKFKQDVLQKRAKAMIRRSAGAFLAALHEGQFDELDLNARLKLSEEARKTIEDEEKRQDKVTTEVREIVESRFSALANQGALTASDLNDALTGKHPYITPDKARTLKEINENPPTGEGSDSVRAIMGEYYLGERNLPRINATRARLRALQAQLGRPNPLIMKAANELQSDQTAVESVDAARMNRDIKAAQDEYDANTPPLPFNMPLFNNQRRQDKAKIGEAVRKGRDPKEVVKQKSQEMKNRADSMPDDVKKMRDFLGNR